MRGTFRRSLTALIDLVGDGQARRDNARHPRRSRGSRYTISALRSLPANKHIVSPTAGAGCRPDAETAQQNRES